MRERDAREVIRRPPEILCVRLLHAEALEHRSTQPNPPSRLRREAQRGEPLAKLLAIRRDARSEVVDSDAIRQRRDKR